MQPAESRDVFKRTTGLGRDRAGIDRITHNGDVLVHCCYMGNAEIDNEHFRRLLQHTMAGGDSVGKIASRANAKTLVLTHHRPRKDERMLDKLADAVARDFSGHIVLGSHRDRFVMAMAGTSGNAEQ